MGSVANQCHAEWGNKIVPHKALLEHWPNHGISGRVPIVLCFVFLFFFFLQNIPLEFLKMLINTFNVHVAGKLGNYNNSSLL